MRDDLLRLSSADVPFVAVVAGRSGDGTHAGILYPVGGTVHILHQRWDCFLERKVFLGPGQPAEDAFAGNYAYATPNLEDESLFNVVRWCELVAKRYIREGGRNGPPFAFRLGRGPHFAARGSLNEGAFIMAADGMGLTCSLFVLAIFAEAKASLVKLETWEHRDADDARHTTLIDRLGDPRYAPFMSPERLRAVRGQLPCVRVRPEETVAACIQEDIPASFHPTAEIGDWILGVLDYPARL